MVALLEQIRTAVYARPPNAAPVVFALDEVASIAPLPSLPAMAAEGGGQGLMTLACLQDLSQARARWGEVADGFFSLFNPKLVFPGIGDQRTLALVSALAGDEKVQTKSLHLERMEGYYVGFGEAPGSAVELGLSAEVTPGRPAKRLGRHPPPRWLEPWGEAHRPWGPGGRFRLIFSTPNSPRLRTLRRVERTPTDKSGEPWFVQGAQVGRGHSDQLRSLRIRSEIMCCWISEVPWKILSVGHRASAALRQSRLCTHTRHVFGGPR